ncbi:hypothetical protein IG631_22343 [Alternaria alternata]|nr:hypothetical protein IG631_22343 [Alternaria alternata]
MFGTSSCASHPHRLLRRTVCYLSVVSSHTSVVVIHLHHDCQLTLLSPEQTNKQNASAVDCEQCTDRIEFGGEDLEYYERKRKLADCCTDVCALKCSLCCANFNQLCTRQHD